MSFKEYFKGIWKSMKDPSYMAKIIIETFFIILAVFLGLIAKEQSEIANNRSKSKAAVQRIETEIQQNLKYLQKKQDYYFRIMNSIDSVIAINGNQVFNKKSIPNWSGINPPLLSSSSFKTAASIGIFSYIKFQIADEISKVYLIQEEIQKVGSLSINIILSGELPDYQSIKLVLMVFTELINGWFSAANNVLPKIRNGRSE